MTAANIFLRAISLIGYTGDSHIESMKQRAIPLINAAYIDVCRAKNIEFTPIKSMSDSLALEEELALDVMVYGLAMFIAQSEGDDEISAFFCDLYNRKRGSLATSDRIIDVMPRG